MSDHPTFDAVGLAGGGNRCYWQSGFLKAYSEHASLTPRFYVAVSAGAYHGAMHLAGVGDRVRAAAFAFAETRQRDLDWRALKRRQSPLVVGDLYRRFLAQEFGEAELDALKAAPPMLIQLSALPGWMPGALGALGSIGAYQIEKLLTDGSHSRAGRHMGLKPVWISTHNVDYPSELVDALVATSSVPPFMPVGRLRGRAYLDGGLVDNPPLIKLREVEEKGWRTLLLSTRFGRKPPEAPNRTVVGPSENIPVNKFAVGDPDGIRHAYEVGLRDGKAFSQRSLATISC
ncbi:patatin-like phospholipase family protein [Ciceribacter sp. L1K23]|uniref:patatin-like phospholipase family protein n=1 Tax=Ciceribacter sp. L1K23 TaxID=2820276 RepID=UPI001B838ACC|nr:patatin-like phospholipase family protein [Ciceribacter sp. L1K23]MBR0555347.1 patatin-like phospholipase family protein [Ciceribacter sp. L1K23]